MGGVVPAKVGWHRRSVTCYRSCPNARNVFWDRGVFLFPVPLLNPGTLQPMTAAELDGVFCDELVQQELDDTTACIPSCITTAR